MTIKTLEYIHRVLIDAEKLTEREYSEARKRQHEFEEIEPAEPDLVGSQKAAADLLMKEHSAAMAALNDFESKEW